MQPFTREDLQTLLSHHDAPCVSLYLPMKRGGAEAAANALRFKNAWRSVEASPALQADKAKARALSERVAALEDSAFWQDQRDTLAVFASPDYVAAWRFGEVMPSSQTVADSFHTKPLVKHLQGDFRYLLLTVTKENITLWEGGRDSLDPVRVPGMPRGMRDLEPARPHEIGVAARNVGAGKAFYGVGAGGEANGKEDLKHLFRAVDRALLRYTHDQKTPLILATFDQYHALFHEVSKNPALLDEGVGGDPEQIDKAALRTRALAILKPRREKAWEALREKYAIALDRKRATNYLPNIAKAALYGRVDTLLVVDEHKIPGVLNRTTGEVTVTQGAADGPDLLDDVSELVLGAGGHVYVLPTAFMPTNVGIAAIYRY